MLESIFFLIFFNNFWISYFFISEAWIAVFAILSGIRILNVIKKENFIDLNNSIMMFFIIFIYITLAVTVGSSVIYKGLANQIRNEENEDELSYRSDFFKYITPLDITDEYINVKVGDKFGYINNRGETVIDFKYDYASQFIKINLYEKEFDIALVCENGSTYVIMKNQRVVMSYRTESNNNNYEAKQQELENVYRQITSLDSNEMPIEIKPKEQILSKINVYQEENTEDYTYKYDYNDMYDIIVTESSIGLNNRYELVQKANPNMRITLNCEHLSYDKEYLYIFKNGNIPYYNPSTKEQGWFDQYGKKQSMTGNAQILDMYDDKMLIKNYNNDTVYFINNEGQIVSPVYKDIYILSDKYIVKGENNKYRFIDQNFNPLYDFEYEYIINSLESDDLMNGFNMPETIKVNEFGYTNLLYDIVDLNGNRIAQNLEYIYNVSPKIEDSDSKTNDDIEKEILQVSSIIKTKFVGDEFYNKNS